ncbi:MAG: NUDIX hydrolase [Proteobacteria bacterium]|nr:MAG: NUDIX hydrolase [Pseudomonadota bacterium]
MKKLTEKKIKSNIAYQGSFLKVLRDEVELPNGKTSFREYIPHPGASLVIPVTSTGKLVMIRQFRYPLQAEFIEFPAGKLDQGEDPLTAAKRELAEEIGQSAKLFQHLTTIHPVIGYSDEKIEIYLAKDLYEVDQHLDEDEFLNLFETTFDEAMELMKQGKITDVKTMIALFWYEKVLKREW